jgi:hypothetical protein
LAIAPLFPHDRLRLAFHHFDLARRNAIREENQIGAPPTRARRQQPIEAEKKGGVSDRLRAAVVTVRIAIRIDAETSEGRKVGQLKRPDR